MTEGVGKRLPHLAWWSPFKELQPKTVSDHFTYFIGQTSVSNCKRTCGERCSFLKGGKTISKEVGGSDNSDKGKTSFAQEARHLYGVLMASASSSLAV